MIARFVLTAVAACVLLVAPDSYAEPFGQETRSREVSHADLDLSTEAGAAVMLGRLQRAASLVCQTRSGPSTLSEQRAIGACRGQALESAVSALNAPMVTALHTGDQRIVVAALSEASP